VCPGCGFRITVEAIDRQLREWEDERQRILAQQRSGCAGVVLLLVSVGGLGAFWYLTTCV
jgi:hypothetical protein